jgi:hypothetical protein
MIKKKLLIFFLLFGLYSCANVNQEAKLYEDIGFLGKLSDIKVIDTKLDAIVSNSYPGSSVKITNLLSAKTLIVSNIEKKAINGSRLIYVSESVVSKLEISKNLPYIKIEEIRSSKANPTFVANKAEIFQEEKKVLNTSRVSNVEVISLGKPGLKENIATNKKIYLEFGSFYYIDYAKELQRNLKSFLSFENIVIEGGKKNYHVTIGPISSISIYDQLFFKLKNKNYEGYKILIK